MAANPRLSDVVHYVIAHCPPDRLGATKLNKVLWYADMLYYRQHGKTITGAESYVKLQHGPVPKDIGPTIGALKQSGKIVERATPTPAGVRREFLWLEPAPVQKFAPEEIDALRDVMGWICNGESAASISELTHDALWEETAIGQDMPVKAGAVVPAEITPEAIQWAQGVFDEHRKAGNGVQSSRA